MSMADDDRKDSRGSFLRMSPSTRHQPYNEAQLGSSKNASEFDKLTEKVKKDAKEIRVISRKMAAFPDLLKAAKYALARFEHGPEQITNPNDAILDDLRSAIAKAESAEAGQ